MDHEGPTWTPDGARAAMTYTWTNGAATNSGNAASGVVATDKLAVVVGAPNSTARLVRTEWHFQITLAGTATGVSITPDWPIRQVCATICEAQQAGSTGVPSPLGPRTSGTVLFAPCDVVWANQSFASSQGAVALNTHGLVTSHAERMTPPAGGWQVAASFRWDDDAGFVTGFGSNFRWHWRCELATLWRL